MSIFAECIPSEFVIWHWQKPGAYGYSGERPAIVKVRKRIRVEIITEINHELVTRFVEEYHLIKPRLEHLKPKWASELQAEILQLEAMRAKIRHWREEKLPPVPRL